MSRSMFSSVLCKQDAQRFKNILLIGNPYYEHSCQNLTAAFLNGVGGLEGGRAAWSLLLFILYKSDVYSMFSALTSVVPEIRQASHN